MTTLVKAGHRTTLPSGATCVATEETVTGRPEYVRNQITRHRNAGTLIHNTPPRQVILHGTIAYQAVLLVWAPLTHQPHRDPAARILRWATITGSGACLLFAVAAILGWFTAGSAVEALTMLAGGIGLVCLSILLAITASKLTHHCPGHHCQGCPDS